MPEQAKQKIVNEIDDLLLRFADDSKEMNRSDMQGVAMTQAIKIYDLVGTPKTEEDKLIDLKIALSRYSDGYSGEYEDAIERVILEIGQSIKEGSRR